MKTLNYKILSTTIATNDFIQRLQLEIIKRRKKALDEFKKKVLNLAKIGEHAALTVNFIKWIVLGSIVGLVVGPLSTLFLWSLQFATDKRNQYQWFLYLLPLGGALVSFLYMKFGKTSSQGNNLILEQIYKGDGEVPLRMAPLVFIGTVITHFFGGSAGREGTAVQMGGSIAEFIGKIFKVDKADRRLLLMCGISSGFSSVFGTPLAGTIFGMEVVAIGNMHYEALIPCFTASFVGNLVATYLGAKHSHYAFTGVPEITLIVIIKVIVSSILFGFISIAFSEMVHGLKKVFSKYFKSGMVKSFIGGIIVIILTYMVGTRDYLGLGTPMILKSFETVVSPLAFFWKLIFTSITLGAGFQGGEVTPLFFIGSTFGNAISSVINLSPSFLAGLGLVAVFCGATNTPISSFVLGLELFGGQGMIYIFMACVISYLFSGHYGIYTSQLISVTKSKILQTSKGSTVGNYRKNL